MERTAVPGTAAYLVQAEGKGNYGLRSTYWGTVLDTGDGTYPYSNLRASGFVPVLNKRIQKLRNGDFPTVSWPIEAEPPFKSSLG